MKELLEGRNIFAERIDRRELLRRTATAVALAVVRPGAFAAVPFNGIGYDLSVENAKQPVPTPDKQKEKPKTSIRLTGQNIPIFAAATGTFPRLGVGVAGLVRLSEDGYGLYTIGHVNDMLQEREIVEFSGIGRFEVNKETQMQWRRESDDVDSGTFFRLNPDEIAAIKLKLDVINPLVLDGEPITPDDFFAMPVLGANEFKIYTPKVYLPEYNCTILKNPDTYPVCIGQSGTPLLRIENNKVTNKVVGITYGINSISAEPTGISPADPLEKGRTCGSELYVRMNG